jgi:RES domain-containing protein
MIHRPELLDALQASPERQLDITAWRHMFGRLPPDVENTRGARWNPSGVAAIYLSRTREGAIAEGDHAVAVQPLRPKARRVLYEVHLTLDRVFDLTADVDLARVGLTSEDLGDDDFSACQEVGAAVAWLEHDGLLVPSARSSATNLVVYPSNRSESARYDFADGEELSR